MSKKVEEVGRRKVLEYAVVEFTHPIRKTVTKVPRIVGQRTVGLNELIERAERGGYSSIRAPLFKAQFESVMELVKDYLEEGNAVNLGGYLRIQPYLMGNVNAEDKLTRANELAVRVAPLRKLRLKLNSFAWRLKGSRVKEVASPRIDL